MKVLVVRNFIKFLNKNLTQFYNGFYKRNYCASSVVALQVVKLQEKSFTINPIFGKLFLNSSCNCIVQPTKLQENCATVTLWGVKHDESRLELDADIQDDNTLKLEVYPNMPGAFCEINMPIKYDIEANMEDVATIQLEKMENDNIEISTQKGSITMKNVKSGDISITTDSGHVMTDVLQGNIFINARKTTFTAKRLQGMEICIQASHLNTEIESSYVEKGIIFAESGNISIKNLHGSTKLHLHKGKLTISGFRKGGCIEQVFALKNTDVYVAFMDLEKAYDRADTKDGLHGCLEAVVNEGEADLQVSRVTKNSLMQVDCGRLNLSLIDASIQNVDASSPHLEISPAIKSQGSETQSDEGIWNFKTHLESSLPSLWASVTEGRLKLSVQDWFSSLQIKGNS